MKRTRLRRRALPALTLMGILAVLPACPRGAEEEAELRVGLIAPLTGSLRDLGASCLEGAELAVSEVNHRGGVPVRGRGRRLVLVVKDSQARPEAAVAAAQELINREGVAAIIGPYLSSLAIPAGRMADRAGIPMITPISTHPGVTEGTHCVLRACFTDLVQGAVMARFAYRELHARRAAVLYDVAGDFNRTIADIFRREFVAAGGAVVATETYATGEDDFRPLLKRIQQAAPQVLFLPNYTQDLLAQAAQLRELEMSVQLLGCDTMGFRNRERFRQVEGAYFSTHFSAEAPAGRVREFTAAYQAAYRRAPTSAAALTYDSFGLLVEAVRAQDSLEPRSICAGLRGIRTFEGVTGRFSYDGSPDPRKSTVIIHVEDGRPRFYARVGS